MTQVKYWAIALVAGLLVWLVLGGSLGVSAGLVVFVLGGLVLGRVFGGPAGETAVADAMREAQEAAQSALADPREEAQAEAEDAAVMAAVRSRIEPQAEAPAEPVAAIPEASMETTAVAPEEQAAPEAASAPVQTAPKASTLLAGEEELASRKGSWRYEPAAETPAAPESPLLRIRGINPQLLPRLEAAGITEPAQIAALDAAGVAALTETLKLKRKERITQQRWVEQARALASKDGPA